MEWSQLAAEETNAWENIRAFYMAHWYGDCFSDCLFSPQEKEGIGGVHMSDSGASPSDIVNR